MDGCLLFSLDLDRVQLLRNSFVRILAVNVEQYPRMIFSEIFSFESKKIPVASKMIEILSY